MKDNYAIQAQQAKQRFLTYDQEALSRKLGLETDEEYLYTALFSHRYRIHRVDGSFSRLSPEGWVDANSFSEVMTLLDLICDSRDDRRLSGQWKNMRDFGSLFYSNKAAPTRDPDADHFAADPEGFAAACRAFGGVPLPQGDVGYSIPVFEGLPIGLQLWLGDEDFPAQLKLMWDANALQYLRFETMHYAVGLLMQLLKEEMKRL